MRALALLVVAGCIHPRWEVGETASAVGPPGWKAEVEEATDRWNVVLMPYCGERMIILGPGGHKIKLVTESVWRSTEDPGTVGYFDGDVTIREGSPDMQVATLVHELGHAIGLQHVAPTADPRSVMHPAVNQHLMWPSDLDVLAAASAQGCL